MKFGKRWRKWQDHVFQNPTNSQFKPLVPIHKFYNTRQLSFAKHQFVIGKE